MVADELHDEVDEYYQHQHQRTLPGYQVEPQQDAGDETIGYVVAGRRELPPAQRAVGKAPPISDSQYEEEHKKSGKELADEILLKNDEGISGGKFTKIEMYKSLLKLELDSTFHKYIIENSEKILSLKKIPSPIDDIIDAILLSLV